VFSDDGRVLDEKKRDRDEDENNVENMNRYEKSLVQVA